MFYISAYIAIADPVKNVSSTLSPGNTSAMAFFYIWMCFYGVTWHGESFCQNGEFLVLWSWLNGFTYTPLYYFLTLY